MEIAFNDILFPMLRKELRLKLTKEAKDGVIRACRSKLYEWIKVGKYSVKFEEEVSERFLVESRNGRNPMTQSTSSLAVLSFKTMMQIEI